MARFLLRTDLTCGRHSQENTSAMPNAVKTRFAGLLRELLRRFDEDKTGAATSQPPRPVASAVPPFSPVARAQAAVPRLKPVAPPRAATPPAEPVTEVELPLPPVLENLPPQLRSRLTVNGVDLSRASISISTGKILPQLAQGAVKITFGELRRAAPSLFNVQEEYDSLPVVLPLGEVLVRLSPNLLARNPAQKSVVVPEEISGPFGGKGQGVVISTTPTKPSPAPPPPMRIATPVAGAPVKTTPPPVAPPPPVFASRSIKPAVPEPRIPALPLNGNGSKGNGVPVQPIIPTIPLPPPPTAPAAPKPLPSLSSLPAQATISVSLAALSENWPEALRLEIAQLSLTNAQVMLPVDLIEPALKRGRVTFTWRNLRSWVKPAPSAVSAHDGLQLELPLQVVAPIFLARQGGPIKMARQHQPAPLSGDIPNLFFGFPQPQPPYEIPEPPAKTAVPDATPKIPMPDETHFVPKPVESQRLDTNYFSRVESDTNRVSARPIEAEIKSTPVPATDFSSRHATPKEVVSRAMALNGIAGSLVALPDGLMVASQTPPTLNADTLAAFLPQIYARVTQCTKELRMGELNNLNFTVGNVPWKIFRVNGVYFAAFGRAGEQLPTAQLAMLAAELDRKKQ